MKPPQRVVWSEGMLVSPQHFQQGDLYHERLLESRLTSLAAYTWGVSAQGLDPAALAAGQIKLTHFVGALPGGLVLAFDGGDAECPPARPIDAHFGATQPCLEVFIGSPKEREGVPAVTREAVASGPGSGSGAPAPAPGPIRTRYRARSASVVDQVGGAQDLVVSFAERNVVILFGNEPRTDFDTIKIAEIVRDASGRLAVDEGYIPPVLRISASTFIMDSVRALLGVMTAKRRELHEDRRQRDPATVEFNANDVTRFLQLFTLNSSVAMLTEVERAADLTAQQLHLMLLATAGQLATFSPGEDPTKLPAFLYTDLRSTFRDTFKRITDMLQVTARAGHMPVPLELNQGFHVGRLSEDHVRRCPQYVLAVRSELPEDQIAHKLPGFAKIASYNQLAYILRAATPGIPLRYVQRPPAEVPIRPGVTYFTLETQNDHFKPVLEERTIAIYLPAPFDPARVKLELYGIPRGS